MADIYISIGSNIEREANIISALNCLKQKFENLIQSPVYECPAFGFDGPDFYNMVVGFKAKLSLEQLLIQLNQIEIQHGRPADAQSFASRTLDLDLLLYNNLTIFEHQVELPRSDIIKYPFVLRPLAEIAGHKLHPQFMKSYQQLWDEFDKQAVDLRLVNIYKNVIEIN